MWLGLFVIGIYNGYVCHITVKMSRLWLSYTEKTIFFSIISLSHGMGYDCGDSFIFDFEPNGIPFGSKSKGKLSPRSYPIQFEKKWKYIVFSV